MSVGVATMNGARGRSLGASVCHGRQTPSVAISPAMHLLRATAYAVASILSFASAATLVVSFWEPALTGSVGLLLALLVVWLGLAAFLILASNPEDVPARALRTRQ